MAIVFNGIDRLIEVTDPAIVSLDAQKDLYSAWKLWAQDGDNSKYAPAFSLNSVFGGNPTIEGQNAPRYFFLTNFWRVLVDNGNVVSVGLNLYTENYSTPYIVAAGSGISDRNSDAVSVNAEAIEYASFNNFITIDQDNITGRAVSGTAYPTGTKQQPVNNLVDAKAISINRGIDAIFSIGNLTIPSGHDFSGYHVTGESAFKSIITCEAGAIIPGIEFDNCRITGILDGGSDIRSCILDNVSGVDGIILNSYLGPGIVTLGTTTKSEFFGCFSNIPGTGTPIIDMGGANSTLAVRDYNGGLELRNFTGINAHSIDVSAGNIKLDPTTVTSGTFTFRGVGRLLDASNGSSIRTGTWNGGVTVTNDLINISTIGEAAAYASAVYIDTVNGVSGTQDPIGLERLPVNNLADAITIAESRNTSRLIFLSDFTFANTDSIQGYDLLGEGQNVTTLTFIAGCILAFCTIRACKITGDATGIVAFTDCYLKDYGSVGLAPSSQDIVIKGCRIGGVITLPSNYSGGIVVLSSYAEVAIPDYPVLDIGNSTANLLVDTWSGEILMKNITQNNKIDIRFGQGEMILETASVTSAEIHAVGAGYLRDELGVDIPTGTWNTGVTVINDTITETVGGGGGSSPWTEVEKDEVIQYSKKASDNAEQANLKL